MSTSAPAVSTVLKKNRPRLEKGALDLKMLRLQTMKGKKNARTSKIEIFRRLSLSLSVITFTLIGCAFGIEEGRNPSKKNLVAALLLALFALLSYLLGKELKSFAIYAFLLPHVFILFACALRLRKIARGFT